MRRKAVNGTNTDVNLRLAEIDRFQLCVDIRDVDNRDVPGRVKIKQLILRKCLLRGQF